jgi:hypothetical protein
VEIGSSAILVIKYFLYSTPFLFSFQKKECFWQSKWQTEVKIMIQLDLFNNSKEDYLFGQMQKLESSMDRRTRSLFALISEIQDQLLELKKDKK